jgi:hypothetical protein
VRWRPVGDGAPDCLALALPGAADVRGKIVIWRWRGGEEGVYSDSATFDSFNITNETLWGVGPHFGLSTSVLYGVPTPPVILASDPCCSWPGIQATAREW